MSCNCNTADPNCEPCAFCTPPGVKCLPDCNPPDPCPEEIDLCCVRHSGEDELCSDITNGEPLCELLIKLLEVEIPDCCELEMSIDLLSTPIPLPTTTTSTTSTTTTSSTSTTSTSTTTTKTPFQFCYTTESCSFACECNETTNVTMYTNCLVLAVGCVLYTNNTLTTTAPAGFYGAGGRCHVVSTAGVITGISNCSSSVQLCYTSSFSEISTICTCLSPIAYYSTCSPLVVGCILYTNPTFTTFAPNGYYSDNFNVYEVTGNAGVITNITNCPITPCQGCDSPGFLQICCQNSVTGQYQVINNGGGNHPGCCCLGPTWFSVDDSLCNINPQP
jgi:hypothetical protein